MGTPPMLDPELLCARMYTGPLFEKYAAVLRAADGEAPPPLVKRFEELCLGNRYAS